MLELPYSNLMIPNKWIIICSWKVRNSDFGFGKSFFGNYKIILNHVRHVVKCTFCSKLLLIGVEQGIRKVGRKLENGLFESERPKIIRNLAIRIHQVGV
jgi:hypothetical protein